MKTLTKEMLRDILYVKKNCTILSLHNHIHQLFEFFPGYEPISLNHLLIMLKELSEDDDTINLIKGKVCVDSPIQYLILDTAKLTKFNNESIKN